MAFSYCSPLLCHSNASDNEMFSHARSSHLHLRSLPICLWLWCGQALEHLNCMWVTVNFIRISSAQKLEHPTKAGNLQWIFQTSASHWNFSLTFKKWTWNFRVVKEIWVLNLKFSPEIYVRIYHLPLSASLLLAFISTHLFLLAFCVCCWRSCLLLLSFLWGHLCSSDYLQLKFDTLLYFN